MYIITYTRIYLSDASDSVRQLTKIASGAIGCDAARLCAIRRDRIAVMESVLMFSYNSYFSAASYRIADAVMEPRLKP